MKRVPVIIFGIGGVGQALIEQMVDGRDRVARRGGCLFDVIAVSDSASWLWQPAGLDKRQLLDIVEAKKAGKPVSHYRGVPAETARRPSNAEILLHAKSNQVERAIVVDVTAVEGMEPVLDAALESGYSIAMANKKALAGKWATAKRYFDHPRVRHESTVGAGQPVVATLRYLLDTNDPIRQIEGQLSGTLGFICGRLDEGIPFSQAVAEAKDNGFTEPDPREDLGGKDVMRKVMILGRMAGWPLEESDIDVESLFPPEMAALSVDQFMVQVTALDATMRNRVQAAAAEEMVLRYVAEVENGAGVVGLKALPAASPLANLKYISYRTARFDDEPLLIGGKGAGVEITASGVLGDMISLVREGHAG